MTSQSYYGSLGNGTPAPRVLTVCQDFNPEHCQILCCQRRFIVLVAGRRWGKTTLGLFTLVSHAASLPGQICYFIGPTERQAEELGWRTLMELVPPLLIQRMRRSDLEIELINGSIIKLHGPESLRGVGLDFVVLDEYAYMPAALWPEVVRPMLADREGRALLSSTPRGFNHFYDLYHEAQARPEWGVFHHTSASGGYISRAELNLLRSTMDPRLYAQEIEASFQLQHGRVYHAFSREHNITDVALIPNVSLLVGMDFNINPMTAVVAQNLGGQCQVSGEIVLPHSNTFEMMQELSRRYPQQTGVVYPDPSGRARKTSAPVGQTDHSIIRDHGWQVYRDYMTPYPIVDRINSVNAMLQNAKGTFRLFIDRQCQHLIRALEGLTYKEGTHLPDTSTGLDHITDALYLIMGVFPMFRQQVTSQEFLL